MKFHKITLIVLSAVLFQSCQKELSESNGDASPPTGGELSVNFIFKFDSNQVRLNGLGQPSPMPAGNAGQSPRFNSMSAHYVELAQNANTLLGSGAVVYHAPEVTTGGSPAIDFTNSKFAGNNQIFLSVPIKDITPGSYNWLRVSLAYQNYNVYVNIPGDIVVDATVASFIGYNTYLTSFKIKDSTIIVNANKLQGYWAIEGKHAGFGFVNTGQAPPGATTVPNPLAATSPIPPGSCVVTGAFTNPLVITGNEKNDINIVVSLSTNKSFEWNDVDGNGTYDPVNGDKVIDMGIRGMIPIKQ